MFVSYMIGIAASAVHSYLMEKTGQAVVRDLRCELFAKFETQSLAYHRDTSTGELVTRVTSDVDAMEASVLQGLTSLLEEIVTFIVVAGMVLWISPVVGAASILPLAFAFIFIRKYNLRVKSIYEGVRQKLGRIGSFVQDRLAGVQVTQSFAREAAERRTSINGPDFSTRPASRPAACATPTSPSCRCSASSTTSSCSASGPGSS